MRTSGLRREQQRVALSERLYHTGSGMGNGGRYHKNVKSWIEVSARRLTENYRAALDILQHEAGPGRSPSLLGVIKANAYGHGAAICAPVLARAGAEWLGVTDAAEGAIVRQALAAAGIEGKRQPQILVMCGHFPEDAPALVKHSLVPVVWNLPQLVALRDAAAAAPAGSAEPVPVHLEIDTGMSRQGITVGAELRDLLQWLHTEPRLRLDGVLTHFASAEVANSRQTARQRELFEAALRIVAEQGLSPAWVHAGNTSVLDNACDSATLAWLCKLAERSAARPMVREGLGLYGYCLPLEGTKKIEGLTIADHNASRLHAISQPIMTWKTRILSLCEVEPGARIGYNGSFVAKQPMRLALLPVGYADGLRRELSSSSTRHPDRSSTPDDMGSSTVNASGWVILHGRRAPIIGRISMNLTTVDVSAIDAIEVGDEVILLGPGVTADDHAALAGTIAYEILCGIRALCVLV